jgi:hypothetical protein
VRRVEQLSLYLLKFPELNEYNHIVKVEQLLLYHVSGDCPMTTKYPRLQCYVQPATMARIKELSRSEQRLVGAVVDDAIANYTVDKKSWTIHQAAFQSMLALTITAALARKTLSTKEMDEAQDRAQRLAAVIFGPLGKRPFDVDVNPPTDERLLALFEALS